MLAVMERQGSTLPRIIREAWDGEILRTLTRSPLCATGSHITVIGHVTPGELRLRLKEAQVLGGTMNRFLPVASRRTQLLPDGGNIPAEELEEYATPIAEAVAEAAQIGEVEHSATAIALWRDRYPYLRRSRPDGAVASILARAAPQVRRIALAYAVADRATVIDEQHLAAALAIWRYVEATAEWMFGGAAVDHGEVDKLVNFIAAGGATGRTRTQITADHYGKNKPAAAIAAVLGELIRDGRIRQETVPRNGPGRPKTRYFAC